MKELDSSVGEEVMGPGEVLSEFAAGIRIKVLLGEMSPMEAQELYNSVHSELNLTALRNPGIPWERGSTQARELEAEERRLKAERKADTKEFF